MTPKPQGKEEWKERIRLACYLRPSSQIEAQQITDSAIELIENLLSRHSKNVLKKTKEYGDEEYVKGFSEAIACQHYIIKKIINDLESNPNEDGSASPNIMHWIEKKQVQLWKKYNLLQNDI